MGVIRQFISKIEVMSIVAEDIPKNKAKRTLIKGIELEEF
jgi:hypothetical protein